MYFKKLFLSRPNIGILFIFISIFFIAITCLQPIVSAQSISQCDLENIYRDSPWYNGCSTTTTSCTTFSAASGSGAPDGAQFPNLDPASMATAIDKWIVQQNPNSTLKGLGATIVASSQHSNVNPFLIVAIAGKESSLGDPGDYNVSHGNNSFGRTATESQPHFDGAKRWYKWGSAKASVDYLAPENQGAQGGGDMATYLRTQFGDDLDSNSLIDLIQKYAPPSENDTGQYIAQVQQWINELVELAGGTAPTQGSGSSTSGSSCSCSQSIIATAMSYAWPTYHQADYLDMKPEYQTAVSDAASKGWYVGGGEHPGIDCGGFVTIVMRNSGADPNYNSGNCNTTCQKQYLDQHPELYENLGAKSSTDGLEPGDIAINSSHTYFYAGSSGYPGYNALSASFGSWRSPMASTAYFSNGDGSFTWYRVKCPQNQ